MKKELQIFLTAIMFFTRIPCPKWVDHNAEYLKKSAKYFSLVGIIVGSIGALVFYGATFIFSTEIAILLNMISTIYITGAFHEDGFADVCDGLGGGWTKEKILLIMKDSRLGTYGAVGLALILTLKFLALREIPTYYIPLILISGHSLSRFVATTLIFTHPYVRDTEDSKAKPAAKDISINMLIISGIFGILPLFFFKTIFIFLTIVPMYLAKMYLGAKFKKMVRRANRRLCRCRSTIIRSCFLFKCCSTMDIYIIRHTSPNIEKGICYGQTDIGLANTYKEEFNTIIESIPNLKDFSVISSPLKRCAQLAKQFSNDILFDNRLKELDFGDWEMKSWDAIPKQEIDPWMEDFVNIAVPNGESYTQLALRVNTFFEEIAHSQNNKNLIIITHAGVIRAFLSKLLNIPLKDSFNIKIGYGDIFHLKRENENLKTYF